MKSKATPLILTWLTVGLVALGCAGGAPSYDLGDGTSGAMLWNVVHHTYADKDLDRALFFADKNLEIYGATAREMQASLSGFPATDPPEATFKVNDLNHVAMTTIIKGDILAGKGDRAGAEKAYTMVIEEFGYAQAQDLGEWGDYASSVPRDAAGFIKLAEVARYRLAEVQAGRD